MPSIFVSSSAKVEIKAKTPSPSKARGELLPSLQTIQTYRICPCVWNPSPRFKLLWGATLYWRNLEFPDRQVDGQGQWAQRTWPFSFSHPWISWSKFYTNSRRYNSNVWFFYLKRHMWTEQSWSFSIALSPWKDHIRDERPSPNLRRIPPFPGSARKKVPGTLQLSLFKWMLWRFTRLVGTKNRSLVWQTVFQVATPIPCRWAVQRWDLKCYRQGRGQEQITSKALSFGIPASRIFCITGRPRRRWQSYAANWRCPASALFWSWSLLWGMY